MFVNPDFTIRSPIEHYATKLEDFWTNIRKGLGSLPDDFELFVRSGFFVVYYTKSPNRQDRTIIIHLIQNRLNASF